jgi:hypothetical protein
MSGAAGLQPANTATAALAKPPAPEPEDGPPDMTNRYNTPLTPEEEAAYQAWGAQQAAQRQDGRNPAKDTFDYDMRGFWKSGAKFAANGHGGDTFKKPNHPTFSTYSKYNGVDGYQGGQWGGGQNGQPWTFTPSQTNLQMSDAADLQRYFQDPKNGEQHNRLILPQTAAPVPATPTPAAPTMPVPPVPPAVVPPAPAPAGPMQTPAPTPVPVPPAGAPALLQQLNGRKSFTS